MKKILTLTFAILLIASHVAFAGVRERTLLDGVTGTGASTSYNSGLLESKTISIVASSVSTGATIAIQTSIDGSNWSTINTQTISANGTTEVAIVGLSHKYIRANITVLTDGTYSVYLFGKD